MPLHMLFNAILTFLLTVEAYDNGLALTPPMGWNTWCTEDACGARDICNETLIKSIADSMASSGMKSLGYEYVNLDDCWSAKQRDSLGRLQPNADQFPNGMKSLADYVHNLGLKIGIYTCIGTHTCKGGRPGSYGYYEQDAQTLADWTIDFVKMDYCNKPNNESGKTLYTRMSHALNKTGRPMIFSLCNWGNDNVQDWGFDVAHMYRIQMDHIPFWKFPPAGGGKGFGQGTADIIEYIATLNPSSFVRQFGWMDPDFLETLFPITMPLIASRTEFTFWSMWSAPLVVATDVRGMTAEKKSILMNPEAIAIDQDPLATAADRVANYTNGGQVWFKPLKSGALAVVLYNSGASPINVTVEWDQLHLGPNVPVKVRDIWKKTDVGVFQGSLTRTIGKHDVFFSVFTQTK